MENLIAVTGASGQLGGRVAHRLAAAGADQRLVVRNPAKAPRLAGAEVAVASFGAPEMADALKGVRTLLLVSATEDADRTRLHTTTVDAALQAGVERIVYISFLGAAPDSTFTFARDHWHTEEHIRASGAAFTFLRDSLYMDVLPHFADDAGVIRGPAGDGRVGAVARADIADVAAAVLAGTGHDGQTYDLTGPETISLYDIAAELTRVAGRPVRYVAETLPEAYASRAAYEAPDWAVAGWVTSYAAVATGELDVLSDTVERIAGHRPMSFAEYLAANPDAVAHLR